MIDKAAIDGILKQIEKNGNSGGPNAMGQLGQMLAGNVILAAQMAAYLAAKQELGEMKRELGKLQVCIQQLEAHIEQYGPGLSGRSNVNHALVNWMVSFAESYYSLAVALGAKDFMLPRVLGFLNGKHLKSGGFMSYRTIDAIQAMTKPETPISRMVKEAVARSMKQPPAFLKP